MSSVDIADVGSLPGPLIVDSDMTFLDQLLEDPKAQMIPPTVSSTGQKAQLILAKEKKNFTSILVSTNLPHGYTLSVIRFSHRHRPGVPIYLLETPPEPGQHVEDPFPFTDLKRIGIQGKILKPLTYAQMLKAINFDARKTQEQRDKETGPEIRTLSTDEADFDSDSFVPISTQTFLTGSVSYFDLFVKLPSGRLVKILKAGDSFSQDRLKSYIKKGTTHFYLRKEAQEMYLSYCNQLLNAISKSKEVQPEIKVTQTLKHGDTILKFLGSSGLSHSSIQYASGFVQSVQHLIKETQPNNNPFLESFLKDVSNYEHGVGVSVLASMIGKMSGFVSDRPAKVLGMAAMFHDIGMQQLPPELHDENEEKMNEDQLELYHTHPELGANVLRSFREIDPISLQAVLQHHERKNRTGFPNRLPSSSINKVAEIIGVSDEFVRLVKRADRGEKINPVEEMVKILETDFSNAIKEAFHKVLIQKAELDL